MENENNQVSGLIVDEDALDTSDNINLFKELIRVIERDIDKSESANARKGLSVWGVVVAMAGCLAYIFGETRKFKSSSDIPFEEIQVVFLTGIFLLYFVYAFLNILSGKPYFAKAGRLSSFNEALSEIRGGLFVRGLVSIGSLFLVITGTMSLLIKIISGLVISIIVIYCFLYFYLSFNQNMNIGNRAEQNKVSSYGFFILQFLNLSLIVAFGSQIVYPVNEKNTVALIIGLLLAAFLFLFELLISSFSSSKTIDKLADLRDDIIFLRVDGINDALIQYQIIKEGKSLTDELSSDFDRLDTHIKEQENLIANQLTLVNKIIQLLPVQGDTNQIKERKRSEFQPFYDSLNILSEKGAVIRPKLLEEITFFNKRLYESANISGDFATLELIKNALIQRFENLDLQVNEIETFKVKVEEFIKNPDLELMPPTQDKPISRRKRNKSQVSSGNEDKSAQNDI